MMLINPAPLFEDPIFSYLVFIFFVTSFAEIARGLSRGVRANA